MSGVLGLNVLYHAVMAQELRQERVFLQDTMGRNVLEITLKLKIVTRDLAQVTWGN